MANIAKRTAVALGAALALACAGGTGQAQAQDAKGDTTGLTRDTIKIGVFGPMTGSAALFGKAVFGVESVFKEVNDKGGINGRKIEIVREDTACDPTRGLAAFKKLVSQEQVFAINGGLCSNVMMALKDDIAKSKVPLMVIGAATPGISHPLVANMFQPVATTDEVGRTMIDYAMSRPDTTRIAFVSHSDDWGKSNRDPAVQYLKEKYKIDPVADLSMERGSSDATPQILRLRSANPQFIVMMMYPAEVAIFVRDAYKYGLKVPLLAPQSISLEDTRDRVGGMAAVQNMAVYYPYAHPTASPEMQKYARLINKYYPSEKVESFSFLGMSGAYALIKALQDAGPDLTREKLIAQLNTIKDFDSGISSAPITFTPQDHAGIHGGAMAKFKGNDIVVVKKWEQ
jgi:branched-chain amino acid transport system substrate-binding protein